MDMIEGYDRSCPLCRLTQDRELLTRLHWEDEDIIVIDCLVCRVPMAVLKAHRDYFTAAEKERVRALLGELLDSSPLPGDEDDSADCLTADERRLLRLLPDWLYNERINWVIDWEQRQIPDHPHCHLRPFPFPGTRMWERATRPLSLGRGTP